MKLFEQLHHGQQQKVKISMAIIFLPAELLKMFTKRLSISNLITFDKAVMIYKIMNGLCPDNLRGRLATRSQISNYPTRNQLDLDTPRQNLEFSKNSFFYYGEKTWNEIPLDIRMSSTITIFKRKLKEFLKN